jgi:hypothetical protein
MKLSNWKKERFFEGKNNKIEAIKRLSYRIKKIDNLKKLIQLRIS